jgi:hypothetical protein
LAFIDILEESLLKVRVAQPTGVIVPQYTLHMGGRKNFPNHVEDSIVVESVSDLLKFFKKAM